MAHAKKPYGKNLRWHAVTTATAARANPVRLSPAIQADAARAWERLEPYGLRWHTAASTNGQQAFIRAAEHDAVRGLEFVLEVEWENGRPVHEYHVLRYESDRHEGVYTQFSDLTKALDTFERLWKTTARPVRNNPTHRIEEILARHAVKDARRVWRQVGREAALAMAADPYDHEITWQMAGKSIDTSVRLPRARRGRNLPRRNRSNRNLNLYFTAFIAETRRLAGLSDEDWVEDAYDNPSAFDQRAAEIAAQYRAKGYKKAEAERIGRATAAKVGRRKYGQREMTARSVEARAAHRSTR